MQSWQKAVAVELMAERVMPVLRLVRERLKKKNHLKVFALAHAARDHGNRQLDAHFASGRSRPGVDASIRFHPGCCGIFLVTHMKFQCLPLRVKTMSRITNT
jgi:hypothetical protein